MIVTPKQKNPERGYENPEQGANVAGYIFLHGRDTSFFLLQKKMTAGGQSDQPGRNERPE